MMGAGLYGAGGGPLGAGGPCALSPCRIQAGGFNATAPCGLLGPGCWKRCSGLWLSHPNPCSWQPAAAPPLPGLARPLDPTLTLKVCAPLPLFALFAEAPPAAATAERAAPGAAAAPRGALLEPGAGAAVQRRAAGGAAHGAGAGPAAAGGGRGGAEAEAAVAAAAAHGLVRWRFLVC